jgi:fused signal recognition particle receptor
VPLRFFRKKKGGEKDSKESHVPVQKDGEVDISPSQEAQEQTPQEHDVVDAAESLPEKGGPQKADPSAVLERVESPKENGQEEEEEPERPTGSFFARFRKKKTEKDTQQASEEPVVEETVAEPEEEPPGLAETQEPVEVEVAPEEEKQGIFSRLRNRLSKTRKALTSRVDGLLLGKKEIDEELLEELEEILITSDMGVNTTMALIDEVREQVERKDLNNSEELKESLQKKILDFLQVPSSAPEKTPVARPHVIMVVGVNGVGKTTTIGKLAARFIEENKRVLLVAADTFRAAAVEQLEIWAERVGADIVRHKGKADPSAVAFDGMQAALARGIDVVIIDTAGRLHTKVNLMEELKKISRTVAKHLPDAPHETLLVLDATTGQNAISQAQMFHEATEVTGIVLTKLDGTAKGGVVVGICHSLGLPLKYIGLGEKVGDLQEFDAQAFMKALF